MARFKVEALLPVCFLVAVVALLHQVVGHGRLVDPPSRASAWRFDFNVPHDYNDNAGNCGNHWAEGCGICGDDVRMPQPRPHEAGGTYGTGVIVAHYRMGQTVRVKAEITKNHRGYFVFKLCANNNLDQDPGQECFDRGVLKTADGQEKWPLPDHEDRIYLVDLKLPEGLVCAQCILQWTWTAGNSVGTDEDLGTTCLGCGPQEIFRACADVAITPKGGSLDEVNNRSLQLPAYLRPPGFYLPVGQIGSHLHCVAAGAWAGDDLMTLWCKQNCGQFAGDCPESHCLCTANKLDEVQKKRSLLHLPAYRRPPGFQVGSQHMDCVAAGAWSGDDSMTRWCKQNCGQFAGECPESHCLCTENK